MYSYETPPVAIGGIGGSGTRLIAQCVGDMGYFMGSDLNEALDNLWFALLFKRESTFDLPDKDFANLTNVFIAAMTGRQSAAVDEQELVKNLLEQELSYHHPPIWLQERAKRLLASLDSSGIDQSGKHCVDMWGWKAPNTHFFLNRFWKVLPDLKYIHVVRNGLDMAYSNNQNQLEMWGGRILGNYTVTPYDSLRFWCAVHQRILKLVDSQGKSAQFLLLNYDEFVMEPKRGMKKLEHFLDVSLSKDKLEHLLAHVKRPDSMGRYKQMTDSAFRRADVEFVQSLGFDVSF